MDILTIKEAALYLKCSASSIRALVREKRIPFFRVGNKLFFKKESIDVWVSNQEVNNLQKDSYEINIRPLERRME